MATFDGNFSLFRLHVGDAAAPYFWRRRLELGPAARALLSWVSTMAKPWLILTPLLVAAALSAGDANAADAQLAIGEVAVPPVSSGVDRAQLKRAAEGELEGVDKSRIRNKKRTVIVSVAVIKSSQSPFGCTVNALLRDAKTGTMLAIIEGNARGEGDENAELRSRVLHAALRSAVSQIPAALPN